MLKFCTKCGRYFIGASYIPNERCDVCGNITRIVPEEYFEDPSFQYKLSKEMEEKLRNELVKTSPDYDPKMYNRRDSIVAHNKEIDNKVEAFSKQQSQSQSNIPKCPTCGSTNISKIGTFNRMLSTGFLGLASGKIGKTMRCKNCGYNW